MNKTFIAIALGLFTPALFAKPVRVITTTTDLAWMVKQIGGAEVDVSPLLKGTEDPHHVETVPEFIRLAAEADMVCSIGLDLEVGWILKVVAKSGNAKVQPGGPGFCEAGQAIETLEKPTGPIDRSMGDVHPSGNPHFWLSPKHFAQSSNAVVAALLRVDPAHTAFYQKNQKLFKEKMDNLVLINRAKLVPAQNTLFLEYHKEFAYFFDVYGLKSMGSLEEIPGSAPSVGRIAAVSQSAKEAKVGALLAGDYAPTKTVQKFSELSKIPALVLPLSLRLLGAHTDYIDWQNYIVSEVLKHATPLETNPLAETVSAPVRTAKQSAKEEKGAKRAPRRD